MDHYTNAWSAASERLTGITQDMLDLDGVSPREAVERFLAAVGDRGLYSDEVDFDRHWLTTLFDAAGISLREQRLRDWRYLTEQAGWTVDTTSRLATGPRPMHDGWHWR